MAETRHHHGFSLLEVLIALFILSCGLQPLSAMVVSSLQQLRNSDADSRLLLAASNLAEARQLATAPNGVAGPLAETAQAGLHHTVQLLWPDIQPAAILVCRHADAPLAVATTTDCPAPGRLWLQLAVSPARSWQLPLE